MDNSILGLDVETTPTANGKDIRLASIQFYFPDKDKSLIVRFDEAIQPVEAITFDVATRTMQVRETPAKESILKLLREQKFCTFYGYFDAYAILRDLGVMVNIVEDGYMQAFLIPSKKIPMQRSLEVLTATFLSPEFHKVGHAMDFDFSFPLIGNGIVLQERVKQIEYACMDPVCAWKLSEYFNKTYEKYMNEIYKLELDLIPAVAKAKITGINIKLGILKQAAIDYDFEIKTTQSKLDRLAGRPIKVNSSRDLGKLLYEERGNPATTTAKGSYSTAADVLEKLSDPIVSTVMDLKKAGSNASSLKQILEPKVNDFLPGTFEYDANREWVRVHADMKTLHLSQAGRIYMSPSLTQLSERTRTAVIAPEGKKYYYADISSAEAVLFCFDANESVLVDAYEAGKDLLSTIAEEVFHIDMRQEEIKLSNFPAKKTRKEVRDIIKVVVYATLYGSMGATIARELNVTSDVAEGFQRSIFETFKKLSQKIDSLQASMDRTHMAVTPFGRFRLVTEDAPASYRKAVNTRYQSGMADVLKMAIVKLNKSMPEDHIVVVPVFDAVLVEIPESTTKETMDAFIKDAFKINLNGKSYQFRFKSGVGDTWSAAKKAAE